MSPGKKKKKKTSAQKVQGPDTGAVREVWVILGGGGVVGHGLRILPLER